MGAIAIIPARSGSKRIPGKNTREFLGVPCLVRAIRTVQEAGCFEEILVSTDDDATARLAREAGASVPFLRSPETSGDHATTLEVLREVLKRRGGVFDAGCCVYPVTPLLRPERLIEAMDRLKNTDADFVLAALRYPHPVQRAFSLCKDRVDLIMPEFHSTRTQDLQPVFHDAGQFYAFRLEAIFRTNAIIGPQTAAVVLEPDEAVDIDNEEDWLEAEMRLQLRLAMPSRPA